MLALWWILYLMNVPRANVETDAPNAQEKCVLRNIRQTQKNSVLYNVTITALDRDTWLKRLEIIDTELRQKYMSRC